MTPQSNMEAAGMNADKRFRMYGQDFYCPLISGDSGSGTEQVFQSKPALISDVPHVPESNGSPPSSAESVHDDDGAVISDSTNSKDCKAGIQETKKEADNADLPTTVHLVEAELVNDVKTEDLITAVDAPATSNLGYFHPETIKISSSNPVEMTDICTNTSQPLFAEIAVGNSQPEMMEASTGMSQKDVSTIDCGIQTSQELLFSAVQQAVPSINTSVRNEEAASTSADKKLPIVFPRVRCQTSGPEIPAKVPRLSELDQGRVNLNPIYSSTVTFEFNDEESDKENDSSILRQRGIVRNLMKESTYLYPTKAMEPDVGNDENGPSQAGPSSSGSSTTSSRGPFLRVGLSKKLLVRKPLHPRTFDWE